MVLAGLFASGAVPAFADDGTHVDTLYLQGGESICWIVLGAGEGGSGDSVQHFYYVSSPPGLLNRAARIRPQRGKPVSWALTRGSLHLFYESGAHFRYSRLGSRREGRLPGGAAVLPVAVAGSSGAGPTGLWAVVDAAVADAVEQAWFQKLAERRSGRGGIYPSVIHDQPKTAPATQSSPHSADRYHLVHYDGADWRPGFPGPDGLAVPFEGELLLAVRDETFYLMWRGENEDEFVFTVRDEETWEPARGLSLPAGAVACQLGATSDSVEVSALVPDEQAPQRYAPQTWTWPLRDAGDVRQWSAIGPLLTETGQPLRVSDRARHARTGAARVVADLTDGKASVGVWPAAGGKPDRAFEKIEVGDQSTRAPGDRTTRDFLAMMVFGGVVFIVVWRRRESLARPIVIPAGIRPAGMLRRLAGAVVDMAPCAVIVFVARREALTRFWTDFYERAQAGQRVDFVETPPEVYWAWIAFVLGYVGYCMVFELVWSATPGKWLTGLRVLAESNERPRAVQIIARNAVRVVELHPFFMIWPFLVIVLLTQFRQRVGDLLARTVVVQGEPLPPPISLGRHLDKKDTGETESKDD